MFDFFKREPKEGQQIADEGVGLSYTPRNLQSLTDPSVKKEPIEEDLCPYTVGKTDNGNTVLRLADKGVALVLTMNHSATLQLIRLLEATLDEEDDAETDSVSN